VKGSRCFDFSPESERLLETHRDPIESVPPTRIWYTSITYYYQIGRNVNPLTVSLRLNRKYDHLAILKMITNVTNWWDALLSNGYSEFKISVSKGLYFCYNFCFSVKIQKKRFVWIMVFLKKNYVSKETEFFLYKILMATVQTITYLESWVRLINDTGYKGLIQLSLYACFISCNSFQEPNWNFNSYLLVPLTNVNDTRCTTFLLCEYHTRVFIVLSNFKDHSTYARKHKITYIITFNSLIYFDGT
jgi:hypothetical protein